MYDNVKTNWFEDKLVLLVKLKLVINFINKKDREYLKNHDIKIKINIPFKQNIIYKKKHLFENILNLDELLQ